MEVVINDISFSGEYAEAKIYLEGHVTGTEQKKITTVNSSENY